MNDYCLKFADEQEAVLKLAAYRGEDGWLTATEQHALEVIGSIYVQVGTIEVPASADEPSRTDPVFAALSGYHVNLRLRTTKLPKALLLYQVQPVTPTRVWG